MWFRVMCVTTEVDVWVNLVNELLFDCGLLVVNVKWNAGN